MRGDRFDYWVRQDGLRLGLEVSGTLEQDLEARHRQKFRQLNENPYGAGGYVVTVGFADRRVILSCHPFADNQR
jgi:hypothetical protein